MRLILEILWYIQRLFTWSMLMCFFVIRRQQILPICFRFTSLVLGQPHQTHVNILRNILNQYTTHLIYLWWPCRVIGMAILATQAASHMLTVIDLKKIEIAFLVNSVNLSILVKNINYQNNTTPNNLTLKSQYRLHEIFIFSDLLTYFHLLIQQDTVQNSTMTMIKHNIDQILFTASDIFPSRANYVVFTVSILECVSKFNCLIWGTVDILEYFTLC